uniref:Uncharacterized protein n=1 Tax=Rhizophora mucronata TaxID=61149 RepID=A0A2P2NM20_RHIMU
MWVINFVREYQYQVLDITEPYEFVPGFFT